jgi:putative ABC transport system permease protein
MVILLTKVLRDIQRRPLRTILTVLGIMLGVAGIVAISYTGRNLTEAQRETYASARQPDITLFTSQISPTLTDIIERRDTVQVVDTRMLRVSRVSAGGNWLNTQLIGVDDFSKMSLSTVDLARGRFPGRGEIAFDVGSEAAFSVDIGDTVAIQRTAGAPIHYVRVSGFVRAPQAADVAVTNRATGVMPAVDLRRIEGRRYNNYLMIRVEDPRVASRTLTEVNRFLNRRGIATGSSTVRDPEVFVGSRELDTLLLLLRVFSVIGISLSGFLVINTIAAIMVEETRQVGIIKAVGGPSWQAVTTYLAFAALLGVAGSTAGAILGVIGGRLLTGYLAGLSGLYLPPFSVTGADVALALGVGIGLSILAALLPAWFNTRQRVAELLGNIGIVADFKRGMTHHLTILVSHLSMQVAMGARNLTRRPARAVITVLVVAVAVSAYVGTAAVNRSVSETVDSLYELYGGEGWISFEQPVSTTFASRLERHPDIHVAEPWTRARGSIGASYTTIWGVPQDTEIYTARLVAGTWLQPASPVGAVLTTNLAEHLGVTVGDVITLDIGSRSDPVQILGIVDDESTYLGADTVGKLFVRIQDQQRFTGRGDVATIFALRLAATDPAAVDAILADIEQRFEQFRPVTVAMYQDQEIARRLIGILTLMLNTMVAIVGLVGLAGIVNTLIINITERRREFGILRALGASRGHLMRIMMTEGVVLAAVGCLIGLAVGYPLARYLVNLTGQQLFGLEFHLGGVTILLVFAVALLSSAAVSLGPGLIATRIRPIQVLRYE